MQLTQVMPNDIEAELAVIGSIMVPESGAIAAIADILPACAFYREAHQKIYTVALELFSAGVDIDLLSLTDALEKSGDLEKVGGVSYLDETLDRLPTAANVEYYARMVLDKYVRRQLLRLSVKLYNDCLDPTAESDDIISEAETAMLDIDSGKDPDRASSLKSVLGPAMQYIQEASRNQGSIAGISTGFKSLDSLTSGMKNGNIIIVCGRPGMGKSMFIQNIAQHVAIDLKHPCFLYSAEMSKQEIAIRMLASVGRVNCHGLHNGNVQSDRWSDLTKAAALLNEAPIYIDDRPGLTAVQLFAACRQAKIQFDIKLVLVDYIQLMESAGKPGNRQEAIAEISRGLKLIAKNLEVPVVVVSQLSRSPENRPNKRPQLSDLRESGAIEQDADLVLSLYREGYYDKQNKDNLTEVDILKQRNGPDGMVKLIFDGPCVSFRNPEKRWL